MIYRKTALMALFSAVCAFALGQTAWAAGEDTTDPAEKDQDLHGMQGRKGLGREKEGMRRCQEERA